MTEQASFFTYEKLGEEPDAVEVPRIAPDRALARHTDPETSHDAAATVPVSHRQQQVLDALAALGAATCREIAARYALDRDSISPRMKQLEARRLVTRTDERRDGQIVWRLA